MEGSMGSLLFNASGRISGKPYWQGILLLTLASVIITAAANMVLPIVGWLNVALIYPFICVFGKRFHDRGLTAGWAVAVWFASVALQLLFLLLFMMFILPVLMTPEQIEILEEINRLSEAGDMQEAMKGASLLMSPEQLGRSFIRAYIVAIGLSIPIMGWFIGRFRSQATDNQYGPAPI